MRQAACLQCLLSLPLSEHLCRWLGTGILCVQPAVGSDQGSPQLLASWVLLGRLPCVCSVSLK